MAECDQLARPVVRSRAGLDADQAWWQPAEIIQDLRTAKLYLRESMTLRISGMHLENLLCDIETDDTDLHGTAPYG